MNKRIKKKLFSRCSIWHYAEFKNMVQHLPKNIRKFIAMYANANYKLIHTKLPKNIYKENLKHLESIAPAPSKSLLPFEPYLYNKYDVSNEFVKYRKGSTSERPTVHSGLMDVYMDCYNNHDLEKFDKKV